jgi:ATP-dependent Clp protease ATP-binding subunit ClpC
LHQIIDLLLVKLFTRLTNLGFSITLTDAAKDFIADKGYDPQYGARPLNRAIQKYLEDPLAEEILKGELAADEIIEADYVKDEEVIQLKRIKK